MTNKNKFFLGVAVGVVAGLIIFKDAFANPYNYKVVKVSDGDTVQFEAPFMQQYLGLKPVLALRVLGDVLIDGQRLSELLIKNGYARAYFGEKKQSWCN